MSWLALQYEPPIGPEADLSVAIIGVGLIVALATTLVAFPIIDRYVRGPFDLERGQALLLLIAVVLTAGAIGALVGYFFLRDHERFQAPEAPAPAAALAPAAPHRPAFQDATAYSAVMTECSPPRGRQRVTTVIRRGCSTATRSSRI